MRKASIGWMILVFSLLLSACTLPSGAGQQNSTQEPTSQLASGTDAGTSDTQAPAPATPAEPTATPKPTEIPPNLKIVQLYLRYDSQKPEGTFEVMVCNFGENPLRGTLEATFEANGRSYTTQYDIRKPLEMYECVEIYPEAGFIYFRITQPGEMDVTVRLSLTNGSTSTSQVYRERLVIRDLKPRPNQEALQRYQACMERFGKYVDDELACADRLPDYPLAKLSEVAKRWGIYTVIAPRHQEEVLAPWLLLLRTCTPEVQRFLGMDDFEVPVLVARLSPTLSNIGAVAKGASITLPFDESRDSEALKEILIWGCTPGQLKKGTNLLFVHEIVHVLISLYTEGEWYSYFYSIELDDGTYVEGEYPEYINVLPELLNEGLAYWTAKQFESPPKLDIWTCSPEGLVDVETQSLIPYMPLHLQSMDEIDSWMRRNLPDDPDVIALFDRLEEPGLYWQGASAECFWDTLATEEGHEVIGQVLAQLRAYPQKDTCDFSFVDVALAPVVRPETLQKIAQRFDMRSNMKACMFE